MKFSDFINKNVINERLHPLVCDEEGYVEEDLNLVLKAFEKVVKEVKSIEKTLISLSKDAQVIGDKDHGWYEDWGTDNDVFKFFNTLKSLNIKQLNKDLQEMYKNTKEMFEE